MGQFSKISDILNEAVFDRKACASSMKKAVAFGFWGNICGNRFSKFSIPYDIKGSTLFVSVKNPQVMQELIFYKSALLKKIKDYFLPLDIKIEDIRYDYKSWNQVNSTSYLKGDESLAYYSTEDIENVSLDVQEQKELMHATNSITNLSFLDENLKEKYAKNIVNLIKVKKLRSEKGV